jgi:hypothetical protein
MTSRISPEALQRLLATLPAEAQEPFPHLASLNPDQLLLRRVQLGQQLKALEEERKFIDSELQTIYSIAELRHGVRVPGGWIANNAAVLHGITNQKKSRMPSSPFRSKLRTMDKRRN